MTALDPGVRLQQRLAATTATVAGLAFQTTYFWRVVAADGRGATTAGPVWSFTTASLGTPQLEPVSPNPTRNPQPALSWLAVAGAASY